jgi:hypothetical protein
MKKILFTATMLVGFAAVSQAQQGRFGVNTVTPAATVDIVATPANTTLPDALLVPRMTRAQLQGKDAAFTATQNGALAFVTTIDGPVTGKVVNVTTPGFYYYDGASTNLWVAVGGGAPAASTVISAEQAASYVVPATEDVILLNVNVTGQTVTLPTAGIPVGKKLYISNKGSQSVDIIPAPRETANTAIQPIQAAILIYLGGTGAGSWSYLTGY